MSYNSWHSTRLENFSFSLEMNHLQNSLIKFEKNLQRYNPLCTKICLQATVKIQIVTELAHLFGLCYLGTIMQLIFFVELLFLLGRMTPVFPLECTAYYSMNNFEFFKYIRIVCCVFSLCVKMKSSFPYRRAVLSISWISIQLNLSILSHFIFKRLHSISQLGHSIIQYNISEQCDTRKEFMLSYLEKSTFLK